MHIPRPLFRNPIVIPGQFQRVHFFTLCCIPENPHPNKYSVLFSLMPGLSLLPYSAGDSEPPAECFIGSGVKAKKEQA
jgi:hypothetical protein